MSLYDEVLGYLGWRGQTVEDTLREEIESAIRECEAAATPRHHWRIFPCQDGRLEGTPLHLSGKSMEGVLRGVTRVALMAVTLGTGLDSTLSRYSRFDVSRAVLMDAAATALTEQRCDSCEAEIRAEIAGTMTALPRFSPGYGDLPLTVQPVILSVLDAQRRLGLTCTKDNLLLPRKSVTALVPLLPPDALPAVMRTACANCRNGLNCPYPSCIRHLTPSTKE